MNALTLSNNIENIDDFKEIIKVYELYEGYFFNQDLPPVLDEEDESYDKELTERIDLIEENWYDNSESRNKIFKQFLSRNKSELIEIKK